jgi:hypothetical protein
MTAMSAADRIRAQHEQRVRKAADRAGTATDVPRPVAASVRVKPVRSSVDMPPSRHAALKAWCGESAVLLGRSDLPKNDVINALVARLLTDETLARTIRADLRDGR